MHPQKMPQSVPKVRIVIKDVDDFLVSHAGGFPSILSYAGGCPESFELE
jgi:hypothetical protein